MSLDNGTAHAAKYIAMKKGDCRVLQAKRKRKINPHLICTITHSMIMP